MASAVLEDASGSKTHRRPVGLAGLAGLAGGPVVTRG
jgi:hypothetical protein